MNAPNPLESMAPSPDGELTIIALPTPTAKVLSDAAAKENLTTVQFLARAISNEIKKSQAKQETTAVSGPRLLLERK